MNGDKLEGLAPLTGLLFVILLIAGTLLINSYEYLPPPEEIRAFYEGSPGRIVLGAYLAVVSAFFLAWFAGSLRSALRSSERGTGRLSAVAFGGGIAAAALIVVGYAAVAAAAVRAGSDSGISAEGATALNDLANTIAGNGLPIAFALTVAASAMISFRTRVFPTWLAWVSAVLAVGLLSPLGWVFLIGAVIWTAIVSVLLFTRQGTEAGAGAGA